MINYTWRNLWQYLLSWLNRNQEKASSPDDLINLPDALQAELAQAVQSLASPEIYQTAIQTAISTGLQSWQQHLEAANSLIILGNPVEPIAKILRDSLQTWDDAPDLKVVTPFPDLRRPHDPLVIAQQIQQALQPYAQIQVNDLQNADDAIDAECLEQRTTVIVIPDLEQCFLRCIGGWDGIEFLRDITIHNSHCFWVIGCNQWAWDFLDFACQISAYFSEIFPLPELDGAAVQNWLAPIATLVKESNAEIRHLQSKSSQVKSMNNADLPQKDNNTPTEEEHRQGYWNALVLQSFGVGEIAANLWLRSLRIKQDMPADDPHDQKPLTLIETPPLLPSLPSLTDSDRYLLHSTLIHRQITRAHLALSLGESESQIQARIQWLLREGVLKRSNGVLSVCPVYYKTIQSELSNNNFFVGGD